MVKQSFLKGAFILAFASIIVKMLGFFYQIFVIRLIGTEGIGIFNMVYPLYITALVLTTAGLPLAISKYVSEEMSRHDKVSAERLLAMAVAVLILFSTAGAFFLIIFSPSLIRQLYADSRVIPSFLIMVPTLLLVAVSSAIRGFFQGMQDMRPTAFTQLIEQTIRFIFGIALIIFLYPYGLTWAAVGLSIAILLSELGGVLYLGYLFRKNSRTKRLLARPSVPVLCCLFSYGIPVTITRIISTIVTATEASLIPRQLIKAGKTLSQATSFYGELTGVAFTLLMVPSTLTFSLATSLLPAISEAQSKNDKTLLNHRTSDALGITLLAGIPSALILFYFGPELAGQLFKARQAGELLQILALGSVFLYLAQTSTGILQGIGCVKTIFLTNLTGGIFRLSGIYCLGSDPANGITGIAFSYVGGFIVLASLNLIFIKIKTGLTFQPAFFLRLGFSSLVLIQLLRCSCPLVQDNTMYLVGLTLAYGVVFFSLLYLTGDRYTRLIIQQLINAKKRSNKF